MRRADHDDQQATTIATMLTPAGRGAVATVRIRGESTGLAESLSSLFSAADGRPFAEQGIGRVVYGRWGGGVTVPEDVVLCRIDEMTVDVHCHGGVAAPRRILDDLQSAGATIASPLAMQELTEGRFQAEMLDALARVRTQRTAQIVLEQADAVLEDAVRNLQAAVGKRKADSGDALPSLNSQLSTLNSQLSALLRFAEFGRHLTEPWRVVLTGRPNVGKSSLINALVGFSRSIVFDQPGTTRDVVTAEAAFDGWPVELIDTAGIRESSEALEATGIDRARAVLQSADCRVLLLDVGEPLTGEDHALLSSVSSPIVVAHKCDLAPAWQPDDVAGRYGVDVLHVSSKSGEGVEALQQEIVRQLVPEVPAPGTPIPVSPRQIESLRTASEAASRQDFETAYRLLADLLE